MGPAVLLAVSASHRGAAGEALDIVLDAVRPGEFRRSALEVAADLAEDAGRPALAWELSTRLGPTHPAEHRAVLRRVLGGEVGAGPARSALLGAAHARWLRRRIERWARRPWSGYDRAGREDEALGGLVDPLASRAAGYLSARRTVLPAGERGLLDQWSVARREQLVIVASSGSDVVVLSAGRRQELAAWDGSSPPSPGHDFYGWLLPTLVPGERLVVQTAGVSLRTIVPERVV